MMRGFGYGLGYGMHDGLLPFGGFGMVIGALFFVLFIAGVVALVWWATSKSHETHADGTATAAAPMAPPSAGPTSPVTSAPTATTATDPLLQIVRERYARGEIDRKEYQRLLEDLSS